MTSSDWSGTWYGNNYALTPSQLHDYSVSVARGLEGGSKSKSKPKPRGYEGLTIPELRARAAARGIKIPSKILKKADIIAFLRSK